MSDHSDSEYRAWRPGDGLRCSLGGKRGDGIPPCGPPVAVRRIDHEPPRRRTSVRRELLCHYHLGARFFADTPFHAKKAAQETVLMAHWDEYQAELERRRTALIEQSIAAVPDELREVVAAGIAAHEEQTGGVS